MAQTSAFLKILSAYCILSCCKVWKKIKQILRFITNYNALKFWKKSLITDFYQPLCLAMPQSLKKIGSWNLSLHNFGSQSHTKNHTITIFWRFARNYFYLLIGATILQSLKKTLRLNPRKLYKVEKSLQTQRHINKLTTESLSI